MAYINGNLVVGFDTRQANELFNYNRYHRHLVTQHRTKEFWFIFDRMRMMNPELDEMIRYVEGISVKFAKSIRGRVVNMLLIMYMAFLLNPQQYAYRGDLILYANYRHIQHYFKRMVKILILHYGYPDKFYRFEIKKDKLYKLSQLFADSVHETVEKKMVPHYKRVVLGEKK